MIKVSYENREGVVRLTFESNMGYEEVDILDAIGNAILTQASKRGSYVGDKMVIDIKKPSGE